MLTRVIVSSTGAQANGLSGFDRSATSEHGRDIAFDSFALNLVPHDTNRAEDVFVYHRG